MAKKKIKTYYVTGKMSNPSYNVNTEVDAYSVKQAKLRAFFHVMQMKIFSGITNQNLMNQVKKLRITEK